ncbi:MAG TPA: sugar ABC transporter permease [Halococcus sp.]|nr:sugar ABC transporter permease [Halococcus sp.]
MAGAHSPEEIRQRYDLSGESLPARIRDSWTSYLFIVPIFVFFAFLFYYPILRAIWLTFTNSVLGGSGTFIGIDNYVWLVTNNVFIYALGWTLVFVFSTTALQLVLGMLAALLLNEFAEGSREWLSAIVISPYFSASIAGGVIWAWFLSPDFGLITWVVTDLGFQSPTWLAEGVWPFFWMIIAQTWHDFGYSAIIYAAAVLSIPSEQYEAAAMAGAGRLQRFRDVTLPHMLTPTIIVLALRTAWNIAEYSQPFELTGGGPGTKTMILSILTYRTAFVNLNFGRATTIGIVMVIISMGAAIFYVTVISEEEDLYL